MNYYVLEWEAIPDSKGFATMGLLVGPFVTRTSAEAFEKAFPAEETTLCLSVLDERHLDRLQKATGIPFLGITPPNSPMLREATHGV